MKKWLALVVASLLVLSMTVAFAATPSKTTSDNVTIDTDSIATSTGVEIADDFVAAVAEDSEATDEIVADLFELTSDGTPAVDYFDDETKDALQELLGDDVDLDTLELSEIIPLVIENYDPAYGDIEIKFNFNTKYSPDQKIAGVLGIDNDNADTEWAVLPAAGQEDGSVVFTFAQEVMEKASAAKNLTLGVLNTPAE